MSNILNFYIDYKSKLNISSLKPNIFTNPKERFIMKNLLLKTLLLLSFVTLTNFGYSEVLYYAENTEAYNVEGIEYCVSPNNLALISGKLFLNCAGALMPITNLRYEGETVFVTPKAYLYLCPNCRKLAGFGHVCSP